MIAIFRRTLLLLFIYVMTPHHSAYGAPVVFVGEIVVKKASGRDCTPDVVGKAYQVRLGFERAQGLSGYMVYQSAYGRFSGTDITALPLTYASPTNADGHVLSISDKKLSVSGHFREKHLSDREDGCNWDEAELNLAPSSEDAAGFITRAEAGYASRAVREQARTFYDQGKYVEAVPLYERALALRETAEGRAGEMVAFYLCNLAKAVGRSGDYERAIALLAGRVADFDPEVRKDVLNTLADLWFWYGRDREENGDCAAAIPLYLKGIDMDRPLRPKDAAIGLNRVAACCLREKRLSEAEGYYGEAIPLLVKVYGPNSDEVAKANVLRQDVADQAEAKLRDEATFLKAEILLLQAEAARKRNDASGEIDVLKKRLALLEKLYGPSHRFLAKTLTDLASRLEANGDDAEAGSLLIDALKIRDVTLGFAHPLVKEAEDRISSITARVVNVGAEADFLAARILAVKSALGEQHTRVYYLMSKLADCLEKQERFEYELPIRQEITAYASRYFPDQLRWERLRLARTYQDLKKYEEAIRIYSEDSLKYNECYRSLSEVFIDIGRYGDAIAHLESCLGKGSFDSVSSDELGFMYYSIGDFDKAIRQYGSSLKYAEMKEKGSHDWGRQYVYWSKLSDLYRLKGMLRESEHAAQKVAEFLPDFLKVAVQAKDLPETLPSLPNGAEDILPKLMVQAGHAKGVRGLAVSPDGRRMISAGVEGAVKVWDVATGLELQTVQLPSKGITAVAISNDGRSLALGGNNGVIYLLDMSTMAGREITGHLSSISNIVFSPDDSKIASISYDSSLRLWDMQSGKQLLTLPAERFSKAMAFSHDGEAFVTTDKKSIYIWDLVTGKLRGSLRVPSGIGLHGISCLTFSKKDGILVAADGQAIRMWNYKDKTLLAKFMLTDKGAAPADQPTTMTFSKDGSLLVTGHPPHGGVGAHVPGRVRIWNLRTKEEMKDLPRAVSVGGVTSLAFVGDGALAVAGEDAPDIVFYNLLTGKKVKRLGGDVETITALAVSNSGEALVTGRWRLNFWDLKQGQSVASVHAQDTALRSLVFTDDDTKLASSGGRELTLWDFPARKVLWTTETSTNTQVYWTYLDISPDGREILSNDYQSVKAWDLSTGKLKSTWVAPSGIGLSKAFYAELGQPVVRDQKNVVRSLESWAPTAFKDSTEDKVFQVNGFEVVADGRTVLVREKGSSSWRARLVSFDDGTWAVVDPEGRYDASNGGTIRGLHWVIRDIPVELVQLKERYYEPGLLAKILGYNKEPLRKVDAFTSAALFPEVKVAPPTETTSAATIRLVNRGGGIGKVRVLVNGKEIAADARGTKPDPNAETAEIPVEIPESLLKPGEENTIQVLAWNKEGYLSSRGEPIRFRAAPAAKVEPPTLYVIVAGVSKYADSSINLAFSGKDAADMAAALSVSAKRLFGADKVDLTLLSDYQDPQPNSSSPVTAIPPTRENLQQAFLKAAKAKATDILVVYLSGHGVMAGSGDDADYFYLTPDARSTDLSDPAVRNQYGISSGELTEWVKKVPALKQVMVLDTCAAGGAAAKLVQKRDLPSAQIRSLERLKDRTGFHVLMGAAADRQSLEASRYGQGLLTYALLNGIKGGALREDQFVDVQKLFQHAADEVPRLAGSVGGIQRPLVAAPTGSSFDIGQLTLADKEMIPLATVKPMILRAAFQDEAEMEDILFLSKAINSRLREQTVKPRGAQVVYVDADELPGAWRMTGRYVRDGDAVSVRVVLREGTQKAEFNVSGKGSDLEGLATDILRKAADTVLK